MEKQDDNGVVYFAEHVFDFGPIYDGRCIYCDCRAWGIHSSKPCDRR